MHPSKAHLVKSVGTISSDLNGTSAQAQVASVCADMKVVLFTREKMTTRRVHGKFKASARHILARKSGQLLVAALSEPHGHAPNAF